MARFDPVDPKASFPRMEEEILRFWKNRRIFEKSLEIRAGADPFVLYDGPPFATGLPHYGHVVPGTIKDVLPRYQTMRGRHVERRFGWDCHGLPVEYEMERELGLSGKRDIERYGVARFNEACRGIVLRYTAEWEQIVTRLGRWVDFRNDYKTMDPAYMESIWWVFRAIWDKGLIYEGFKILPCCPRCATPLSNFETNLGYADRDDPSVTVRFRVAGEPSTWIPAWTTTPWTLPSNLALAVGPDLDYVRVRDGDDTYILAEARLHEVFRGGSTPEILGRLRGSELVGLRYEPLLSYFADLAGEGAFRVVPAAFVSVEDGTGVVHIAPGFGEDDYALGQSENLPLVCPVDEEGRFTDEVADFAGREVKEADGDILKLLREEGKLVHRGTLRHSYPHCWRCETPLIYRAVSTWFLRVEALRERLLAANARIRWVPEHVRDGRFGRWLENARDWAISRNRFWGTPLPIWRNEAGETAVAGSIAELETWSGARVTDLHKHFVDEITWETPGGRMCRVPQVLDCWFESGAMPYAQGHYPFENEDVFRSSFPADLIAEGLDQTRGWFYTLTVLGVALFDQPAFRNVVVNGLVLAEDGQKMSKRKRNYPDPVEVVNRHGADALRFYLMSSGVVKGEDLRFSETGVRNVLRTTLLPFWNAYSFFATYARVDGWAPGSGAVATGANPLDRWILSELSRATSLVAGAMEQCDIQQALAPVPEFVDSLTNWYVRRSRRRFWKSADDADKHEAYATLYEVLTRFCRILAPFVPFVAEVVYRNLRSDADPESVHLCTFPDTRNGERDEELERRMAEVRRVVRLGRSLRTHHRLKVRQPLAALYIVTRNPALADAVAAMDEVVRDELNVREIRRRTDEEELVDYTIRPNFAALGPRLGSKVREVAAALEGLDLASAARLAAGDEIELALASGDPVRLGSAEVVVQRSEKEGVFVETEGEVTVGIDAHLTEDLVREGLAREFVHAVQGMRREAGLEVCDRIEVWFEAGEAIRTAVDEHNAWIRGEILAASLTQGVSGPDARTISLNDHPCRIEIGPVKKS